MLVNSASLAHCNFSAHEGIEQGCISRAGSKSKNPTGRKCPLWSSFETEPLLLAQLIFQQSSTYAPSDSEMTGHISGVFPCLYQRDCYIISSPITRSPFNAFLTKGEATPPGLICKCFSTWRPFTLIHSLPTSKRPRSRPWRYTLFSVQKCYSWHQTPINATPLKQITQPYPAHLSSSSCPH